MPKRPARSTPPDLVPTTIAQATLDDHLAVITRAIFQAGLSWAAITARWDGFVAAFDAFSVARVAAYGEADIERLMDDPAIIHSHKKIVGTITNAATLQTLQREFGSIAGYVERFPDYNALFRDAHARFAFLGDLSCYYWLFRTRSAVPRFERWMERQASDHPRMREMVLAARADGSSPEVD